MVQRNPKEVFKEQLADTYIDWQQYCMMLIDVMVEAEMREKDFCEDSRWWYNRMKILNSKLTESQRDYFDQVFEEWLDKI